MGERWRELKGWENEGWSSAEEGWLMDTEKRGMDKGDSAAAVVRAAAQPSCTCHRGTARLPQINNHWKGEKERSEVR